MAVLIETSIGDIVIDLYTDERPKTSLNFLKLCKIKYYNYCLFHYVEKGFIAQTGDSKNTGGDSVWGIIQGEEFKHFEAEIIPRLKHKKLGTVSMVDNGSNCHASQFFLTLREDLEYLDGKHTVFGEVAEGLDILMKFNETYCDKEGRPLQDIQILHTVILDDPFDDPEGLVIPSHSPSPPAPVSDTFHIRADEDINDLEGKTAEEIEEMIVTRESKANAHILEMVSDIPDADAKPPENVLFVCKLNAVTTSEDLEIIFSRFGPIQSCEVIKDQKSGDSLQYAFIEFENEEDCVNAYFKMDNVLIDDRRIHVDFSQSLSKVKHTGKRHESLDIEDQMVSPQSREKQSRYDMVFDDETLIEKERKSKKQKKHRSRSRERKRRYSRSRSTERRRRRRREERRRSKTPERRHRRHRSKSRSPQRK